VVRSRGGALLGEILKRSKGGKFLGFYLRWYEGGKRRIRASKQPTYAEARRMLQAIEGRVARGLAGLDEPVAVTPAPTVARLAERFLAEYSRPKVKTRPRIEFTRAPICGASCRTLASALQIS
jgi:hypothetical protein